MVWLRRGLCGTSFRTQTSAIGGFYLGCSLGGLVYSLIIFSSFNGFVQQKFEDARSKALTTTAVSTTAASFSNSTIDFSNDSIITTSPYYDNSTSYYEDFGNLSTSMSTTFFHDSNENGSTTESPYDFGTLEDKTLYQDAVNYILQYSFSVVAFSMVSLIASVYLIMGARKDKILYFIPWTLEICFLIFTGGIMGLSKLLSEKLLHSASHVALGLVLYFFSVCNCYAVFSHIIMLRKMNRHSTAIINSIMPGEGYSGSVSFEKLQEDLELQEVGPGPVLRQSKNNDEFRYFSIS